MNSTLHEEDITEYASDATTIQEPQGADYSVGARVGRTVPAKWWNWLFRETTKRFHQMYTDVLNMFNELTHVVTSAGLTPDDEDKTQLTQAIKIHADERIDARVASNPFLKWQPFESSVTGDLDIPAARLNDSRPYWGTFVIANVNGKVFRVFAGKLYVSDNLINWQILPISAAFSYPYMAVAYYNGNYYFAYTPKTSSGNRFCISISQDLRHFTTILTVSLTLSTTSAVLAFTEVEGTLYLVVGYNSSIYRIAGEQATVAQTGITQSSFASVSLDNSRFMSIEPLQLDTHKYIIGNILYNNGSFSTLFNGNCKQVCMNKLPNGSVITYIRPASATASGRASSWWVVSTNGTTSRLTGYDLCMSAIKDYVILFKDDICYFTSTATSEADLMAFPANLKLLTTRAAVQIGSTYLLLMYTTSPTTKIALYRIEGSLSSNAADYEKLKDIDFTSAFTETQLLLITTNDILKAVCLITDKVQLSFDEGDSFQDMLVNEESVLGSASYIGYFGQASVPTLHCNTFDVLLNFLRADRTGAGIITQDIRSIVEGHTLCLS